MGRSLDEILADESPELVERAMKEAKRMSDEIKRKEALKGNEEEENNPSITLGKIEK